MKKRNYITKCLLLSLLLPTLTACAWNKPHPAGSTGSAPAASSGVTSGTTAPVTEPEPPKELSKKDSLVVLRTGSNAVRDPFVLYYDGAYYIYGTGWTVMRSVKYDLTGRFTSPVKCVTTPADCIGDQWAPEVHEYKGRFYMFTTYKSSKTGHRGCAVFAADHPAKTFNLISDGPVTPADWDAIDGTLYIDEEGQPWMVFVHEWTSTDDGIGRMACAKLSDDLTHFISEPVELFRADDPSWTDHCVTDGCFLYRTKGGKLLMIWSNWDKSGYAVGIAESESGLVTGPWIQKDELLYSKDYTGEYDGGHGMIFTDGKGQLWMAIHSPNGGIKAGRVETPVLIPLKEENDTLVWDTLDRGMNGKK